MASYEDKIKLLIDDGFGVYIPQKFAEDYQFIPNTGNPKSQYWHGVKAEDLEILRVGPDDDWYWESWTTVLDGAWIEVNGVKWTLFQDGDLWAVSEEMTEEDWSEWQGL